MHATYAYDRNPSDDMPNPMNIRVHSKVLDALTARAQTKGVTLTELVEAAIFGAADALGGKDRVPLCNTSVRIQDEAREAAVSGANANGLSPGQWISLLLTRLVADAGKATMDVQVAAAKAAIKKL